MTVVYTHITAHTNGATIRQHIEESVNYVMVISAIYKQK